MTKLRLKDRSAWKNRFVFPSVRQWVQRNVQSVVSPKYDPVRPFTAKASASQF